jgi:hypothetical protein
MPSRGTHNKLQVQKTILISPKQTSIVLPCITQDAVGWLSTELSSSVVVRCFSFGFLGADIFLVTEPL